MQQHQVHEFVMSSIDTGGDYLFIRQVEFFAEFCLRLCPQISTYAEGLLQATDLLCCESCPGPPTH